MGEDVIGLKKLSRNLLRMPAEIEEACEIAVDIGADELVDLAKSFAQNGHTGQLVEGIYKLDTKLVERSIRGSDEKRYNISVTVLNDTFYATFVELGHDQVTKSGQIVGHVGKLPSFYVAWHAIRKRVRTRIMRASRNAAKKAFLGK